MARRTTPPTQYKTGPGPRNIISNRYRARHGGIQARSERLNARKTSCQQSGARLARPVNSRHLGHPASLGCRRGGRTISPAWLGGHRWPTHVPACPVRVSDRHRCAAHCGAQHAHVAAAMTLRTWQPPCILILLCRCLRPGARPQPSGPLPLVWAPFRFWVPSGGAPCQGLPATRH